MQRSIFAVLIASMSLLSGAAVQAENVRLNDGFASLDLAPYVSYVEDSSGQLGLQSAIALPHDNWETLEPESSKGLNFGFSQSSFWLRFTLQNTSEIPHKLLVHLEYALLDDISFFSMSGDTVSETYRVGDIQPFHQRPMDYPTFLFPVALASGESKVVYMRVASSGAVQLPLSLWKEREFLLTKQSYIFIYGAFLSALLVISVYNLCLYFIVRARAYLLYCVFILSMAGVHGSLDGFAYQWFWPDFPVWHQISSIVFIFSGLIFTVLFTRAVLPISHASKLDKTIISLKYIALASALVALLLPYRFAAMLSGFTTIIVMSGVCFVCLAMLRHSPRIARFYCIAWGIYFFGIVLKSSSKLGYVPHSMLTENASNIGGVVGVIVMSLALADRINSEKREKESAQKESINYLKRFENLYRNALEGIFSFDLKGKLLSANPAFLSILGLSSVDDFNKGKLRSSTFDLAPNTFRSMVRKVSSEKEVVKQELQIRSLSGMSYWMNVSARLTHDDLLGFDVIEGTIIDISDSKSYEDQLLHLASHDVLTGFLNRRAFEERAKEKLSAVQSYKETCCLLYLDLDRFKIVNDLCGHTAGDALLKKLSHRLIDNVHAISDEHTLARLGGDEFGILLSSVSLEKAQNIAETIRESIESFLFVWSGNRFSLGVSIGLVEICPFHHSIEQLLVMADTACYKAKDLGRNRVYTFVESDKELQFRQLEMRWVETIKEAIKEDHFFLVFQNIAPNLVQADGQYHYEILLRLMNRQGNLCAPYQFIPAAERYNLMPNIDRWVLEHYFSWLRDNPEHSAKLGCASINLSTESIGDKAFLDFLIESFERYQVAPELICFEITESVAISNLDNTHSFIRRMKKLGCRFALDDFGTGFSSYAYLNDLNVDFLKIDGVFIKDVNEDAVHAAMVKSICDVAKAMKIGTIAEFVETEDVLQKLIEIGVTYSQGYHIHKPCKLTALAFEGDDAKNKIT